MISRRRFLSGLGGALVALPVLESVNFFGARARAAGGANPVYSVFVRQGNGCQQALASRNEPDRFWPEALGPLTTESLDIAHGLSYSGPQQLRAAVSNPFSVYQDLVGLTGASQELLEAIALRRKSVNDLVREEMQDLLGKGFLSAADKDRLQLHFDAIRDIEVKIGCQLTDSEVMAMQDIAGAAEDNGNRIVVAEMMMDLIALAFACDANRVATLQIGTGNDATRYVVNGVQQNTFHRISHRIDGDGSTGAVIPDADLLHHEIDRIHARAFRHLLDRLSAYAGPSGATLLDDSVALWTNDLANGPPHSYSNIPQIVAGKAGGYLKTGQYIDAGDVTHNKFLNTLINAAGVTNLDGSPYDSFGSSDLERGLIPGMIA